MTKEEIIKIIKPETQLEKDICNDENFLEGVRWGKPRKGHNEGAVIYHIGHVLNNVNKYSTEKNREKLRLIAIIHDSCKYKVDKTKSRDGENHHAMLARRFAEKYITDNEVLEIIELHDEAYNSWCKGNRDDKWDKAEYRANRLIERLETSLNLYLTFYQCDNETGDKESENFRWFKNLTRI
jgi:hypothetical protein